jgi:hypothetical protein
MSTEPPFIRPSGRAAQARAIAAGVQAAAPAPAALLEPDRDQLKTFLDAVFRNCGNVGYVSLRNFLEKNKKALTIVTAGLSRGFDNLVALAEQQARRAAQEPEPAVFSSPVAVFKSPDKANPDQGWQAREKDLYLGPVLSVECDHRPTKAMADLEAILGPPTAVVKSGGVWTNDNGEPEDKVHIYWRLAVPAQGNESLSKLKKTRELATRIVGGDTSNINVVHPLRWPGSYHRKNPDKPKLVTAVVNADVEINLDDALRLLTAAAPAVAPQSNGRDPRSVEPANWGELICNILAGHELHPSTRNLIAKKLTSGANPGAVINEVRDLMRRSKAKIERPEEWQARFDNIPRLADEWLEEHPQQPKPGPDLKPAPSPTADPPSEPPSEPDGDLAPDDAIAFFNGRYMMVKEAGRAVIFEPLFDPMLKRRYFDRLLISDFKALYANRNVTIGHDKNKPILKSAADFWLRHRRRKQFLGGVVFRPGHPTPEDTFNLWNGFATTPKQGLCPRLYDHIRDIICRSDSTLYSWTLNWIARMFQKPAERAEVCIVVRGTEEGSGKSTLGRVLMRLLGQHAFAITDPRHLTGNFNAHLRDCIFLLGDEAFYAGDKAHTGILKTIITEETLTIESKHRDTILVPNYLHLMLTANSEWVVPASLSARRFLVLDADPLHVGDLEYFRELWAELEAGGLDAFLNDMLERDLSQFNWRKPPDTAGLQEQKKRSLSTELAWWMEVLHRGYVWRSKVGLEEHFAEWQDKAATELLYASYQEFATSRRERFPLSREDIGKLLVSLGAVAKRLRNAAVGEHFTEVPSDYGGTKRKAEPIIQDRSHGYRFGSLAAAREEFTKFTRLTIVWEPVDDLPPEE